MTSPVNRGSSSETLGRNSNTARTTDPASMFTHHLSITQKQNRRIKYDTYATNILLKHYPNLSHTGTERFSLLSPDEINQINMYKLDIGETGTLIRPLSGQHLFNKLKCVYTPSKTHYIIHMREIRGWRPWAGDSPKLIDNDESWSSVCMCLWIWNNMNLPQHMKIFIGEYVSARMGNKVVTVLLHVKQTELDLAHKWSQSQLNGELSTTVRVWIRERQRMIKRGNESWNAHVSGAQRALCLLCVSERVSLSRDLSSVGVRGNRWHDWEVTGVTAGLM